MEMLSWWGNENKAREEDRGQPISEAVQKIARPNSPLC